MQYLIVFGWLAVFLFGYMVFMEIKNEHRFPWISVKFAAGLAFLGWLCYCFFES